jgi:hypothetical protein
MADFGKEITSGGTGWVNALAVAQANDYKGGSPTTFLTLEDPAGVGIRIKPGHSSGTVAPVSGTDGQPIGPGSLAETFYGVDLGVCWIYTPGANTYELSFHSDIDGV